MRHPVDTSQLWGVALLVAVAIGYSLHTGAFPFKRGIPIRRAQNPNLYWFGVGALCFFFLLIAGSAALIGWRGSSS